MAGGVNLGISNRSGPFAFCLTPKPGVTECRSNRLSLKFVFFLVLKAQKNSKLARVPVALPLTRVSLLLHGSPTLGNYITLEHDPEVW